MEEKSVKGHVYHYGVLSEAISLRDSWLSLRDLQSLAAGNDDWKTVLGILNTSSLEFLQEPPNQYSVEKT
jgi:hypothetical protein